MKPFTYSKAKKAATEFKPGEIERLCRKSIELHAHSRTTDGADISFLVERFLLAL